MPSPNRLRRAVGRRLGLISPERAVQVPSVLVPRRAPGAARARRFFDAYPRFYETSDTGAFSGRLSLRYEAIFGENEEIFRDARVIDIASHDGRWFFAALETGAAEVVGIEARDELVRSARENLRHYGVEEGRYRFVAGDVFELLGPATGDADVVLCLGYLYHTLRYNELLRRIRETNPRFLVIDTVVLPGRVQPVVRLRLDRNERQRNAVADRYSYGDGTVVGWPSLPALELLVEAYGFAVERYSDWGALLRDNPKLGRVSDYAAARRVTALCVSVD
jgi:ubiquinone/menaquinone biosynthesis C-methylase UbiE